jgi:hypothetical protein
MNGALEVVRKGTKAHAAWAQFYRSNEIYSFIPPAMTVFADWPPVNGYELTIFCNRLSNLRASWDEGYEDIVTKQERHKLPDTVKVFPYPRPHYPFEKSA